jgi:hypothetical protein
VLPEVVYGAPTRARASPTRPAASGDPDNGWAVSITNADHDILTADLRAPWAPRTQHRPRTGA